MENIIAIGKLFSDPNRLKIIKLLLTQPMCVCELITVLRLNQPCISQHLTILKYNHLLKARREGKWIVYHINRAKLNHYLKGLAGFLKTPLSRTSLLKKEAGRLAGLKHRGLLCQKFNCR